MAPGKVKGVTLLSNLKVRLMELRRIKKGLTLLSWQRIVMLTPHSRPAEADGSRH